MILAAVFWGTNYAATKFAALSISPISVVAVRFLVGGLLMYAVLRILEPESKLAPRDLLSMAGLGCLGVAIGQTTFTFGVSLTTAANTGFIFATAPVWGLLFGFVLGLERPTRRGAAGVRLSILGIGVIFYEGLDLGVGEGDLVCVESPRGRLDAKARISGIREGRVFAPFHYGYFDGNGYMRAANELTITERDPASKQPLYKVGAVRVTKVATSDGTPAPVLTNTASAPTSAGSVPETAGGEAAKVDETEGGEG